MDKQNVECSGNGLESKFLDMSIFPQGATHRHKDTMQFYRVARNKVFRLSINKEWVVSSVSRDDIRRRGQTLEEVMSE